MTTRLVLAVFLLGVAAACGVGAASLAQVLGPGRGALAWALLWPAASAALLALAYVAGDGRWLGKRPDGARAAWAWLPWGPYLAFTWAVWQVARRGREAPCDEVAPGLWVGRRPGAGELPHGVQHVLDLTAELPASRAARALPGYRCLPALDATAPDAQAVEEVARALAPAEGGVLVHCAQGHGRSATVAGALLLARGLARDPEEAEARMRRARPLVRLKPAQRRLLAALAPRLRPGA